MSDKKSDPNGAENSAQNSAAKIVSDTIRSRITFKVLADVDSPCEFSESVAAASDAVVMEAIKSAGWAPFHYDRAIDSIAEPWRAHIIRHADCRKIASHFFDWFDDVKPTNKLPAMLSACGSLVLVTWIPQFRDCSADDEVESGQSKEKQLQVDEEHLAATAAMVQNLLLILTASGMGTYWSSGGQFRTPEMFEKLAINKNERLLAAVFVEYPETLDLPLERLPGKQRANRSENAAWLREVSLSRESQRGAD